MKREHIFVVIPSEIGCTLKICGVYPGDLPGDGRFAGLQECRSQAQLGVDVMQYCRFDARALLSPFPGSAFFMSETPAVLRAVIASDDFLTREGLGCLLSSVRSIEIVARVDSHPETLGAVQQYQPDVLVVGIRTPRVNAEAAFNAAQRLRTEYPTLGVVVLAEAGDGFALELLRNGAAHIAYLLDDHVGDLETLVSAYTAPTAATPYLTRPLSTLWCGGSHPPRSTCSQCVSSLLEEISRG